MSVSGHLFLLSIARSLRLPENTFFLFFPPARPLRISRVPEHCRLRLLACCGARERSPLLPASLLTPSLRKPHPTGSENMREALRCGVSPPCAEPFALGFYGGVIRQMAVFPFGKLFPLDKIDLRNSSAYSQFISISPSCQINLKGARGLNFFLAGIRLPFCSTMTKPCFQN